MRGAFLHNTMAACVAQHCCDHAIVHQVEACVANGGCRGSIDLLVGARKAETGGGDLLIAIEVECSARRVRHDVEKARVVGASELWIVVPSRRVLGAVRRCLDRERQRSGADAVGVPVLTLHQAFSRLEACFPLISGSKEQGKERKEGVS